MFAAINKRKCFRFHRNSSKATATATMAKEYNKLYTGQITYNFANLFSYKLWGECSFKRWKLIPSKEARISLPCHEYETMENI